MVPANFASQVYDAIHTGGRAACEKALESLAQFCPPSLAAPFDDDPSLLFDTEDEEEVHGLMSFIQRTTTAHAALMHKQEQMTTAHAHALDEKDKDLQSTRGQLEDAVKELARVRQDFILSNATLDELSTKYKNVHEQYELAESDRNMIQSFYDEAEHRVTILKNQLAELAQKHDRLEAEHKDVCSQHDELKAAHEKTLFELADEIGDRAEVNSALAVVKDERDTFMRQVETATADARALATRIESLTHARDSARAEVEQVQSALLGARKRATSAETRVTSLETEVAKLTAVVELLTGEFKQREAESQARFEREKAELAAALELEQQHAADVDERFAHASTQLTRTTHEAASLKARVGELEAAAEAAAGDMDALRLERDMIAGQEEELQCKCDGLEELLQTSKDALEGERAKANEALQELDAEKTKSAELESRLVDSEKTVASLTGDRALLQLQLEATSAALATEQRARAEAEHGQDNTAHILAVVLAELAALKGAHAAQASEAVALRTQLEAAQDQNRALTAQLGAETDAHAGLREEFDGVQARAAHVASENRILRAQLAEHATATKAEKENVENVPAKAAPRKKASRVFETPQKTPLRPGNSAAVLSSSSSLASTASDVSLTASVVDGSDASPAPASVLPGSPSVPFVFAFGSPGARRAGPSGMPTSKRTASASGSFFQRVMGRTAGSSPLAANGAASAPGSPALA